MSKAFTREDDRPDPHPPSRRPSALPPGAKNYLTPEGAKRLRAELDALLEAASARPQAEDDRIHELRRSLKSAVIVGPPAGDVDVVRFGATVSVRALPDGETARYRIVGVDENDVARGWISWVSPVAKALLSSGSPCRREGAGDPRRHLRIDPRWPRAGSGNSGTTGRRRRR